jgi:hypothetical protein
MVNMTLADLTVLTAVITAPSAGFLVVNVDGQYSVSAATPIIHCGVDVNNGGTWWSAFNTSQGVTAPTTGFHACGKSTRFAVPAGTHTVRYKAHNDGSGTVQSWGGSMNVVFAPFGSAGAVGTGIASASGSGDVLR